MKRREFITLLGGAAAWPLAARAQQAAKLPTIGFLGRDHGLGLRPMDCRFCAAAARTRLDRGSQPSRSSIAGPRDAASASPRSRPSSSGSRSMSLSPVGNRRRVAAKQATSVIPIVVRGGGGPDRHRPRRKSGATGRQRHRPVEPATDLAGKRLELLREVVPSLRRLAIMANVGNPEAVLEMGEVQAAARTLGLEVATSKSGEPRISRPPSTRSRAARTHFMSSPTRS